MKEPSVVFTIPTYRLRDVSETIDKGPAALIFPMRLHFEDY